MICGNTTRNSFSCFITICTKSCFRCEFECHVLTSIDEFPLPPQSQTLVCCGGRPSLGISQFLTWFQAKLVKRNQLLCKLWQRVDFFLTRELGLAGAPYWCFIISRIASRASDNGFIWVGRDVCCSTWLGDERLNKVENATSKIYRVETANIWI